MTAPADSGAEPSIEEILDSIRQIISDEDGAPSEEKPAESAAPSRSSDDEVIELRDRVEEEKPSPPAAPASPPAPPPPEPAPMEIDMREAAPEPEPEPLPEPPKKREPVPVMTREPEPDDSIESLLTRRAESAAASAFSELAQKAAIEKGGKVTIEDVVRYEVRPLLRAWVDKHLPGIVERLLQKELERIARRFEDD